MITCDEIIDPKAKSYNEETKTTPTNFNEKNAICKTKHFYIFFAFLLVTIVLLIAVSINCYLLKYQAKQEYLLPFHGTNKKLKNFILTI